MLETLTRARLLALMGENKGALLVGNHVEPAGVAPLEREFVIAMNGNSNKLERPDMLASFTGFADECPHLDRLYASPRASDEGYVVSDLVRSSAQHKLGLTFLDGHTLPTIGFILLVALELMQVPVRVAGFSWYQCPTDMRGPSHRPDKEREYVKRALSENSFFTFTEETLRWLS